MDNFLDQNQIRGSPALRRELTARTNCKSIRGTCPSRGCDVGGANGFQVGQKNRKRRHLYGTNMAQNHHLDGINMAKMEVQKMPEIRIRDVDSEIKAIYQEKARANNQTLSAYMRSLLAKNLFTNEIEKRENKFYDVIHSLEEILSRQANVTENFHHDIEILIGNMLQGSDNIGDKK